MNMRLIGLSAVVLVAAVLPVAPATAKKTTKSEIHAFVVTNTLPGQNGEFAGGVLIESSKKTCVRNRKVDFFFDGDKFGSAKSDKNGEAYAKTGEGTSVIKAGEYEAKMKKKGNCSPDNSSGTVDSVGTFTPKG